MKRRGALLRAVGAIWDCVGEMVTCMLRASGAGCGECDVIPPRPSLGQITGPSLLLCWPYLGQRESATLRDRMGMGGGTDGGVYKTPKGKRGRASRNLGVHGRDLAPSKPGVVPQTEEKLRKGCEKIKKKNIEELFRLLFLVD